MYFIFYINQVTCSLKSKDRLKSTMKNNRLVTKKQIRVNKTNRTSKMKNIVNKV